MSNKTMSIKEFMDEGFLQEANRLFFHPRGLALSVVESDVNVLFGEIYDYRDDPEGIVFAEGLLDPKKAIAVEKEHIKHIEARIAILGNTIQPVFRIPPHDCLTEEQRSDGATCLWCNPKEPSE